MWRDRGDTISRDGIPILAALPIPRPGTAVARTLNQHEIPNHQNADPSMATQSLPAFAESRRSPGARSVGADEIAPGEGRDPDVLGEGWPADPREILTPGDGVLLVDVQNDFCPGGALPIPRGDRIIPRLNEWIEAATDRDLPLYASRDWHPLGHPSFSAEGGQWPPHCVQDSPGADFHPDLRLPSVTLVVTKGTRFDQDQYSVFDQTGFETRVRKDGVRRLWVGGLAQDVCVCATVLDALRLGIPVHLIPGGSLPVTAEGGADALRKMRDAGARLMDEETP